MTIAIALVLLRSVVFNSGSGNSANQDSTNPASVTASVAALNICISANQPIVTMLGVLSSGNASPDTMAAAVQTAINQEQQLSDTLPAGTAKTELTTMIVDMQTMRTDVAATNYDAETTDISTVSSDGNALMDSCGIS
jgi:hypothetical protein